MKVASVERFRADFGLIFRAKVVAGRICAGEKVISRAENEKRVTQKVKIKACAGEETGVYYGK